MARLQIATDKFDPDFIERRRQGLEVGCEYVCVFIPGKENISNMYLERVLFEEPSRTNRRSME